MQAGTTGINTMRVYNVTKQGEDQDPDGAFIRKYVFELKHVPNEYIHEPHKMSISQQTKCGLLIEGRKTSKSQDGLASFVRSSRNDSVEATSVECCSYPYPIIDEKYSAKVAKDKLSVIRKQQSTKEEAQQVYIKHGSRREEKIGMASRQRLPKASRSVLKLMIYKHH
jgi:deoxyribodipyrimidine photo-lyase